MKIAKQLPTKTDSKLKDNVRFEHPAFGMISVTETCGGDSVLFGSDVDHTYKISLRIQTACMERGLNSDWYHDQKQMVEVEMTHQQFSMLQGSIGKQGVPCTLRYVPISTELKQVPGIDRYESKIDTFSREIEGDFKKALEGVREQIATLNSLIESGKIGKKDIKEVAHNLKCRVDNLPSNMAYLMTQMQDMLETAKNDTKAQVEAYLDQSQYRIGKDRIEESGVDLRVVAGTQHDTLTEDR